MKAVRIDGGGPAGKGIPAAVRFRGFTLVELLVALVIVAVLISLIFSGTRVGIEKARSVKCVGNLRQLGAATRLYANDNSDEVPYAVYYNQANTTWATKLAPYLQVKLAVNNDLPTGPFRCPSCKYPTYAGSRSSYGKNYLINGTLGGPSQPARTVNYRFSQIDEPSKYYYLADSAPNANGYTGREIGTGGTDGTLPLPVKKSIECRHQGKANILFMDFHVESVAWKDIPDVVYGAPPWCPRQ